MEVEAPSNTEALDDGAEVERLEAEAEAAGSEPRVTTSKVEVVALEPASGGLSLKGSQACKIDFGGLFAPLEYANLSPIEEDEDAARADLVGLRAGDVEETSESSDSSDDSSDGSKGGSPNEANGEANWD
ncbi:hypothetical protein GUJ93_ZPchr0003g16740 [Zizania palustris]|uniref:Uncharacterized protein n=1 Tax=Zizania palustris TaxID=103762 RepID=A0A8J5V5M3_ZIZPA|nr:hypothetical protein GUJ93_ZPchr0003g16740 [Zizania palustris]